MREKEMEIGHNTSKTYVKYADWENEQFHKVKGLEDTRF